jgi:hypothetical protein
MRERLQANTVDSGVTVTTRSVGRLLALVLALMGAVSGPLPAAGDSDAAARVRAEVVRLRHSLEEKPIAVADMTAVSSAVDRALKASAEALDAGRLYLSLEALGRAADLIQGARVASEKQAAVAAGLPAFESEWNAASRALGPGGDDARGKRWSRSRAAVRALAEAAEGRVLPLLEGARGFAVATGPKDGLFYIGQAQGESEFAALCASLVFDGKVGRYPLRSMLPELQRLQEKTNAAFQPPRSIDLHDRFIALNSTLKAGLELDAAQSYAGSAYQYLEAVRHYGMLDAPPLDGPGQTKVVEDLAAARVRIDASERDESLARLFLERAASQVAHADGSAPIADEWRSARVILDQVLPAYFAARLPLAAGGRSHGRTIRMTLVRWPYT